MNIASLVVRMRPDRRNAVMQQLLAIPGVDVPLSVFDGPCIVTVEDCEGRSAMQTLAEIHKLPGVIAVGLAYHFSDETENSNPVYSTAQVQERAT